jgi:hypothetical protein
MLKWFIISINVLGSMFMGSFFEGEVSVNISAPQTVTAGDEFQVTVTLNKGKLESFSRLLQELPAGLKATSVNSSNADFSYRDNKIRLIWLRLPEGDSIKIVYTIKVDQRLKGTFDLSGKFSYIENNERQTAEANPVTININPNPNIDPGLVVDIKDFKELVVPEITPTGQVPVACIRQVPEPTNDADNSYIVNLLVYKEHAQKFAKIEETVPAGYTAIKIDSKEGIFVFKDGLAKFLWMSLPSQPYFLVSYRLVPNQGLKTPPSLTGKFSYVVDEKTIIKDIVQKDLKLASLTAAEVQSLVNELLTTPSTLPVAKVEPPITDTTKLIAQKPEKKDLVKPKVKPKTYGKQNLAYTLEPEEGIYFRVQVAAGHKPVNIKRYFRRLKISDEIRSELHDGWRKYSIGSFPEYKQARDYRVHIWNTTPIGDAFVSAYNSGNRITVQEALMITNQSWYK